MRYPMIALVAAIALFSFLDRADAGEDTAQTTCPIMGHAIDKSVYEDYDGKRVYLCCASCIEKFKKDPEAYIEKLEAEGVVLEAAPAAQTECPVMGGAIKKDIYTDHEGKRVYFCCESCKGDFAKDPAKYLKKLEADGVVLEVVSKTETKKDSKKCGPCPFKKTCGSTGGSA
jgi:YHS domain-containing protein